MFEYSMFGKHSQMIDTLFRMIYPPRCFMCGASSDLTAEGYLCINCEKRLSWLKKPTCTHCGIPLLEEDYHAGDEYICDRCSRIPIHSFKRLASLFYYDYHGPAAEMIKQLKHNKKLYLLLPLRYYIHLALSETGLLEGVDYLVPVPIHTFRFMKRGFNQASELCKIISKKFRIPIDRSLIRKRHTSTQTGGFYERMRNIAGAFTLKKGHNLMGTRVLLVDDVYTSGATMRECAKVLKAGGVNQVHGFTICRVVGNVS